MQNAKQDLQAEALNTASTAADSVSQAAAAHAGDSMSIISLISDARFFSLRRERKLTERFEREFWSGGSMQTLYNIWGAETKKSSGISEIFVAGYREYQRLTERGYANNNDLLDAVHRAMRVELGREIDHLESQIPFLATVGSTSPYVGLFGTVWGIMNSFRALGLSTQQATVASVAPGIAEALIATAMGLFDHVEKLVGKYEIFMEEFVSIVNRQLTIDGK